MFLWFLIIVVSFQCFGCHFWLQNGVGIVFSKFVVCPCPWCKSEKSANANSEETVDGRFSVLVVLSVEEFGWFQPMIHSFWSTGLQNLAISLWWAMVCKPSVWHMCCWCSGVVSLLHLKLRFSWFCIIEIHLFMWMQFCIAGGHGLQGLNVAKWCLIQILLCQAPLPMERKLVCGWFGGCWVWVWVSIL